MAGQARISGRPGAYIIRKTMGEADAMRTGQKRQTRLIRSAGMVAAIIFLCCFVTRAIPTVQREGENAAFLTARFLMPAGQNESEEVLPSSSSEAQPEETESVEEKAEQDSPSEMEPAVTEEAEATSSEAPETEPDPSRGKTYPVIETVVGGGTQYGDMFIKSDSGMTLPDFLEELSSDPAVNVATDGSPTVLLYHTHTCEAYMETDSTFYYEDMQSRSDNPAETVVAVGDAIAEALQAEGIGVIHDTTVHDTTYSGSYDRSEQTVREYLEQYPEIDITIDIHRDGLETADKEKMKPTVIVNGKKAAQIMIMSGSDQDGSLGFSDWEYNLRFALRLQDRMTKEYGELMRPLYFCDRNYNMHLSHGSILVEFGTDANSVDEAVYSGTLFGRALAEEIYRLADES